MILVDSRVVLPPVSVLQLDGRRYDGLLCLGVLKRIGHVGYRIILLVGVIDAIAPVLLMAPSRVRLATILGREGLNDTKILAGLVSPIDENSSF